MFGDRPRVTKEEWESHVRPGLRDQGFTDHQLDRLQGFFQTSFQENPAIPEWKPGIDEAALDQTMSYLREHPDSAMYDTHQLDLIESILRKYIAVRT